MKSALGPLGRFHELSVPTSDIRASIEFYERLGFTQAATGDTWSHPYGVLTDGRIVVGLHESSTRPAALTFVHPGVVEQGAALAQRGVRLEYTRSGTEVFNEVGLRDPAGQDIVILEARTYSPVARSAQETSACGYFMHYGMPAADFEAARSFWERLGFVATDEASVPYAHQPLTSDHLDLAFHAPRLLNQPVLVFVDEDMAARIARLDELGVSVGRSVPRGLDAGSSALVEAPEGTLLLLLTGGD